MRIAIIGGGVAGLATAWLLKESAEVILYERESWLGGHARTIRIVRDDVSVAAETGFKYLAQTTHQHVLALIRALGVKLRSIQTSTSLRWPDGSCLVLPPRSLKHITALARNSRWRRGALALFRIELAAKSIVGEADWTVELEPFLKRRFDHDTVEQMLLPFLAASWGMPIDVMRRFAAYDVIKVVGTAWSGLLEVADGASRYVEALVQELAGVEIHSGTAIEAIHRDGRGGLILDPVDRRPFDHVILAVPANRVPSLLAALPEATSLAAADARFEYEGAEIAIHEDPSWMPANRRDWARFNYTIEGGHPFMTEWCGHDAKREVFRSWLVSGREPPTALHHRQRFQHLIVTPKSFAAQVAVAELQGRGGLWLAGMYLTDVDVQESSLRSAIAIAQRLAPASLNLRRLALASGVIAAEGSVGIHGDGEGGDQVVGTVQAQRV